MTQLFVLVSGAPLDSAAIESTFSEPKVKVGEEGVLEELVILAQKFPDLSLNHY